jgi:hypothetical protein
MGNTKSIEEKQTVITRQSDIDTLVRTATQHFQAKEFDDAIEYYGRAKYAYSQSCKPANANRCLSMIAEALVFQRNFTQAASKWYVIAADELMQSQDIFGKPGLSVHNIRFYLQDALLCSIAGQICSVKSDMSLYLKQCTDLLDKCEIDSTIGFSILQKLSEHLIKNEKLLFEPRDSYGRNYALSRLQHFCDVTTPTGWKRVCTEHIKYWLTSCQF